jgi:hypothetical protein
MTLTTSGSMQSARICYRNRVGVHARVGDALLGDDLLHNEWDRHSGQAGKTMLHPFHIDSKRVNEYFRHRTTMSTRTH